MKKIRLSLVLSFFVFSNFVIAKTFNLTKVLVQNSASEKMISGDLTLELNDKNLIKKIYLSGYPIKVALNKLATNGQGKKLKVKAFGLEIVDLYSKKFSTSTGGKVNLAFHAVQGAYDNYNLSLKYNSGQKKWLLYHNGRIMTKLVVRLDIEPGTSVFKILSKQPKVEYSYIVY